MQNLDKIEKIFNMIGSDSDGEIVNAVALIKRNLKAQGKNWNDFSKHLFNAAPHVEDHINFQDKIWQLVSGGSFDDLTLQPSIDASKCEHWHGFITNGVIS